MVNIEANFYFDSGSKPEEIIDSYINRQSDLRKDNISFIYLTDGKKTWGNIDKNQLSKGFKEIEFLLNFYMLKNGYFENVLKSIFNLK